ncbi:hypothetical protein Ahia01_000768700 [Argonauta hians]
MKSVYLMLLLLITFSALSNGLKKRTPKSSKQATEDPLNVLLNPDNLKALASNVMSSIAKNVDMDKVMKLVNNFNLTSFLKDLDKKEL